MSLPFGEPVVGYTFKGENWSPDRLADWYYGEFINGRQHDAYKDERALMVLNGRTILTVLVALAKIRGIEWDDERSWDSDDFPKPIYASQLSCSDADWTDLAPDHFYPFIPKGAPCKYCGKEQP